MTTPTEPGPRRPMDMGLEAVRGISALLVGLSHLLFLNILAPDRTVPSLLSRVEAGHTAVLVFFVLSGYVISWTNSGPCTTDAVRAYARRRFLRLGRQPRSSPGVSGFVTAKRPPPLFVRTEKLPAPWFDVTRSGWPSAFTSPAAIENEPTVTA